MPKPILPPELAAELAPATLLVRGGSERSAYEETSEALFMTSGFVYGSAAEAEAAFKQDGSRYVYSRYRNPTVTMFEERLRLIEGAEACRATASGMAAVFAALLCKLRAGRRCRRLFRDKTHRRAGSRAGRRDPRQREIRQGRSRAVLPAHRPVDVAVQRLVVAEGAGDAGIAGRAAMPHGRGDRPLSRKPPEGDAGHLSRAAEP